MEKNFVSIVVPTYNRPDELDKCLSALENQNFPKEKYEILVVNDGSSVQYDSLEDRYRNKKNIKFISKDHSGVIDTKNKGIQESLGDIIAFIDDDCVASQIWLKSMVEAVLQEKADAVAGRLYSQEINTWAQRFSKAQRTMEVPRKKNEVFLNIHTGNTTIRKDVLEKLNGFDSAFSEFGVNAAEDLDMTYRLEQNDAHIVEAPQAEVYHKNRESIYDFIRQKFEYGRGACFHCLFRRRSFEDLNLPIPELNILVQELVKYTIMESPKRFRQFRKNGYSAKEAFVFSIFGILRRASYYTGMFYTKIQFKSFMASADNE